MAQGSAFDSSSHVAAGSAPMPQVAVPHTGGAWADPVEPRAQPSSGSEGASADATPAAVEPAHREALRLPGSWIEASAAVAISTLLHMVLVIGLGLWVLPAVLPPVPAVLLVTVADEPEEPELPEQLELREVSTAVVAITSTSLAHAAGLPHTAPAPSEPEIPRELLDSQYGPSVRIDLNTVLPTNAAELATAVPWGTHGDAIVPVNDYPQAMSRIAQEILGYLAKGPVTVVWLFDQSESMRDDYVNIRQYLEIVFEELDLSGATRTGALQMVVTSYGKSWNVHTRRPVSQLDEVRAAMDTVRVDPSGIENQCSAIRGALAAFGKSTGRQVMLMLVTDESGEPEENNAMLEATIVEAKAARVPIYVLGRESVFGFPWAHMRVTVTVPAVGGGTVSRQFVLPVDRGPESPLPELLQTDGFGPRRDAQASGFGPYEQARMARETGGLFFMLPDAEVDLFQGDGAQYDSVRMRPYMPDLSARNDYIAERDKYPLRATVWKIISDLNPYHPERGQYVTMREQYSAAPQTLSREIRAEIAKVAQFVKYLSAAEQALRDVESQRRLEVSPRWLANYDLIFAQVLAYKVRMIEYGAYLEGFLKNPPAVPPRPNMELVGWSRQSSGRTVADQQTRALREESRYRFQRLMGEHAGTPWASRAQMELSRGFGVELAPMFRSTVRVPGRPRPSKPIVPPKL